MASRIRPHKLPHDPSGLPSNRTKIARNGTRRRSRLTYHERMAVAIASDLGKDMAGEPLLRGVSFKVERRDRLTLSGRNGSGKTTLLRMLAGETVGRRRRARPREGHAHRAARPASAARARAVACATTCLKAAPTWWRSSRSWRSSSRRMAGGATDAGDARRATPRAQARLEHAGGYNWRERAMAVVRGLGFADADLDRPLRHLLGRRADARARWRARSPATRTCCCSTSPPTTSTSSRSNGWSSGSRRSTPRSSSSPTTAGSSRRSAPRCSSSRPGGRASSPGPGTPGARSRRRASWRSGARSSASRRRSSASSAS